MLGWVLGQRNLLKKWIWGQGCRFWTQFSSPRRNFGYRYRENGAHNRPRTFSARLFGHSSVPKKISGPSKTHLTCQKTHFPAQKSLWKVEIREIVVVMLHFGRSKIVWGGFYIFLGTVQYHNNRVAKLRCRSYSSVSRYL